ncbi:MAG: hypothetical protein ACK5LL_01095 [Suipraeoptans sp.]
MQGAIGRVSKKIIIMMIFALFICMCNSNALEASEASYTITEEQLENTSNSSTNYGEVQTGGTQNVTWIFISGLVLACIGLVLDLVHMREEII